MSQNLADIFEAVAHKRLVLVDLPGNGSNQHELNGSTALREFFQASEKIAGTLTWHYFADDQEPQQEEGTFTFYDARARSAERTGRSEWRFYYSGEFLSRCAEGDELILVRTNTGGYHALVFEAGSAWLRAARLLFGIEDSSDSIENIPSSSIAKQDLLLVRRQVLEALELDVEVTSTETDRELVARVFGMHFPTTRTMSEFARSHVEVDTRDPDATLMAWLDREEQLFRALEAVIIGERIAKGFSEVDDFIQFSLSVQNRRKSRMGHALQNHLNQVFTIAEIRFEEQVKTESGNKPDFIFPSATAYRDPSYDASLLVMLGVKSSAKDRWRQILPEADRIPGKHLCTLEASISEKQLLQMTEKSVHLVIPSPLHVTFTEVQRQAIMPLQGFIDLVRAKQL